MKDLHQRDEYIRGRTHGYMYWKSNHEISIWLNGRDMTINCQLFIDAENVKTWLDLTI